MKILRLCPLLLPYVESLALSTSLVPWVVRRDGPPPMTPESRRMQTSPSHGGNDQWDCSSLPPACPRVIPVSPALCRVDSRNSLARRGDWAPGCLPRTWAASSLYPAEEIERTAERGIALAPDSHTPVGQKPLKLNQHGNGRLPKYCLRNEWSNQSNSVPWK